MDKNKEYLWVGIFLLAVLVSLVGCQDAAETPAARPSIAQYSDTPPPVADFAPTVPPTDCPASLTAEACATLHSLEKVDDYPLYTMRYYGSYERDGNVAVTGWGVADDLVMAGPAWGCSLFAAFADSDQGLYGRNFDWQFSPAVLLFSDPPGGYASVSMVDIDYLVPGDDVKRLESLPLDERLPLLDAPFWPFDGMNEHGLVVGMAAVPAGQGDPDPEKETVDSLLVMREMLDGARDVDEALEIFTSYNINMGGGPPLHYLIADASGRSLLLEFYEGELVIQPNDGSWQQATNFLRASAGESADGRCWRYDWLGEQLGETDGELSTQEALALLGDVAQENTQWSVVYGMDTGEIRVVMGRDYDAAHHFQLDDLAR